MTKVLTPEQIEKQREATRRWRARNPDRANELSRANQKAWREKNAEKHRERAKAWRADNPEKYKENHLKFRIANRDRINAGQRDRYLGRVYGLAKDEHAAMLKAQKGVCKICKREEPRGLVVDHCHDSGKVRGLLCHPCNLAVGYVRNDVGIMRAMIRYIKSTHDC